MPDEVINKIITYLQDKIDTWQVYCVDRMPLNNISTIADVIKDLKKMRLESAIDYFNDEIKSMHKLAVNDNDIFEENSEKWMLNFLPEKLTSGDADDFELKVSFWLDHLTNALVVKEDENGKHKQNKNSKIF